MDDDLERNAFDAISAAGFEVGPDVPFAILNPEGVAAGVFDPKGNLHAASPGFSRLGIAELIDHDTFARVAAGAKPAMTVSEIDGVDGQQETSVLAYARLSDAMNWRLPPDLRREAESLSDGVVVLTTHSAIGQGPIEFACRAYGLTGLQTRVLVETLVTGSIKTGSSRANIAYQTGREVLAEARRRVGEARLPALISRIASLGFGVLPDEDEESGLVDLWGLTRRQAALAGLVAQGASRAEAAAQLHISEAVAMKELNQTFEIFQVSSAAALARKVAETRALRAAVQATGGDVGYLDPLAEPLLYVRRADGSRIAVSDYGPASGRPVLVVHSTMMSRIVGRRLLRALHDAGYRPISIDRPGFGLTDEVAGMKAGAHNPYATAVEDALLVLNHLKINEIDIVARGVGQFVVALQNATSNVKLGAVVIINPALNNSSEHARKVGPYGVFKEAFRRKPAIIRISVGWLMRGLTYERTAKMLHAWMAGSTPDEAAVRNADIVRDFYRAQRMFALGKYAGFVNEQIEYVRGQPLPPQQGLDHWQILVADNDTLHDPEQVLAYWRTVFPHANFERFSEGGRLMALTHPHIVVAALQKSILAGSSGKARTPVAMAGALKPA